MTTMFNPRTAAVRTCHVVLTFCIALFGSVTSSLAQPLSPDDLERIALESGLAQHPYWLSLLHYKPGFGNKRLVSQADDPDFFNHPQGRTWPEKELAATLRAFFAKDSGDRHAQCRFPARLFWLKEQLSLETGQIPEQPCEKLTEWQQTLDVERATLIFPAAYLNSPSSMFGHTLLRLDPADHRRDTPLAAYALNYAANARPDDNGFLYAYKGLFGGYSGMFSIVPYYEKIKQYSDIENRDIWEYRLNLEKKEIDQLLRHAWEVRTINFDYYFMTENCSYHVLSLLETARPGLHLTDGFSVKAIPSDTVRAVVDAGLVSGAQYRASTTTVLYRHLDELATDERQMVLDLATGRTSPDRVHASDKPAIQQARILELAYDYSRYLALQQHGLRDKRATQNYQLLAARSRLAPGDVWPPIQRPAAQPEEGHGTTRLAFGAGSKDGEAFVSFRFRPAYHDVLDPEPGYSPGSQINFLDFRGRYFLDSHQLRLDQFKVIDILSLTPRDAFVKPISWGVDTGFERMLTDSGETNGAQVNGGGGVSYRLGKRHLVYALGKAQLKAAGRFENNFTLGAGATTGTLLFFGHSTAELSVTGLRFALGETDTFYSARWRQSFPIGQQLSLRYSIEHRHERNQTINQAELSLHWYF